MRLNVLGKIRRALQALDITITRRNHPVQYFVPPAGEADLDRWRGFFQRLDTDADGARYLETHVDRLARTMTLTPKPGSASRALELGCYMQMAPALALELGYREVLGGYYGALGESETKVASIGGAEVFRCRVDLFDVERDPFPYSDDSFDCVLACEIIEHLNLDPMWMLTEIRRVLVDGGALILTTPNCASLGSVTRALHGFESPQVFCCYPHPESRAGESPHIREYTPFELKQVLEAGGFRVDRMLTDRIGGHEEGTWAFELLRQNGFDTSLRGEQIYCRAVKDVGLPVERYPSFLYET